VTGNVLDIARGVHSAIRAGAHVITMSLGGPVHCGFVQLVLAKAVRVHNIIVCAAAGNLPQVLTADAPRPVVFPALYPDVIAVGGSGVLASQKNYTNPAVPPRDRLWPYSSRGHKVAVSAPAENVWVAGFDEDLVASVGPQEGTSFAAPHVAAAAALWLQQHGRDHLLGRYSSSFPPTPLQSVFDLLVRETARVPPGWDTDHDGDGILWVPRLLAAQLPSGVSPLPWPLPDLIALLAMAFEQAEQVIRAAIARLIGSAVDVDEFARKFGTELCAAIVASPTTTERFGDLITAEVAAIANPGMDTAQQAAATAGEVVNTVVSTVSDTLSSAAGW